MDYKEQVENLLYDAKDWGGDPHIRKDLYGSAQSITDLLARAEAAEARRARLEEARENANEAAAKWEGRCRMAEQERDTYKAVFQNWHEEW